MSPTEFTDYVSILGTMYAIRPLTQDEDEHLKDVDGYCDYYAKVIAVQKIEKTTPDSTANPGAYMKHIVRHEIVHAFLFESGVSSDSMQTEAWATNEEMVDWFAINGTKVYEAWKNANAI